MYDSLTDQQKENITYKELEECIYPLLISLIQKGCMVIIALIVSIPFMIKFHISYQMWILEFLLWLVWIKETTDFSGWKIIQKKLNHK